ncbi:unnamed protein product, partial [Mesorhabditis belari]|uniref:Peptidase A1 domain-containing protein n=1 Tax=Mesorhabditis belari TaxID=2138241 RepID=A0AAF3ELX3_9BILA
MRILRLFFIHAILLSIIDAFFRIPLTRHPTNRTRPYAYRGKFSRVTLGGWSENLSNFINYIYFGPIQLGTPPQTVTIDFDTGSDQFWTTCNCAAGDIVAFLRGEPNYCKSHRRIFNPNRSKTNRKTSSPFSVTYGIGYVQGTVMFDRVCIPGVRHCSSAQTRVGCASYTDSAFRNAPGDQDSDGLMGLAYVYGTMGRSPIRSIFNRSNCKRKIFAFYLNNSGEKERSEMTLCGTDPAHHRGKIRFLKVAKSSYYWTLTLDRVYIRSRVAWARSSSNAILILAACVGCKCPNLTFSLNGHLFTLPGRYYVQNCVFLIFPSSEFSRFPGLGANWILGDAFLRRFYSVYDYAHGLVGLDVRA